VGKSITLHTSAAYVPIRANPEQPSCRWR